MGSSRKSPLRHRMTGPYLIVKHADDWHAPMTAVALPVTPIADQPSRMREFTLTDLSGTTFASDGPWADGVGDGKDATRARRTARSPRSVSRLSSLVFPQLPQESAPPQYAPPGG